MPNNLQITILGLSITSSWGNGHATTYRHLVRALEQRGHGVTFLERNVSWYAENRDLPEPPYGTTLLYGSLDELRQMHAEAVRHADLVIVGSYVPQGQEVGDWALDEAHGLTAFYDIDTPVTLSRLANNNCEYLHVDQIPRYNLYLSFTGGPVLKELEQRYGSPCARPLYCSADSEQYYPETVQMQHDLGYMGTYSDDRQPTLEKLLLEPAREWPAGKFVVAGPQYPPHISWPTNVQHVEHIPPAGHRQFYNSQRFTLNVTRADMVRCGYAPSIRLFEAAACGTPVISDRWAGLDEMFADGQEILLASSARDVLHYLHKISEQERQAIGRRARARVLAEHTARHRAEALESYVDELAGQHYQQASA